MIKQRKHAVRFEWLSNVSISRSRFEKSLYDLIKGLRNHKGTEKEYTQKSLKECRAEVRSQDMGWSLPNPDTAIKGSTAHASYRPQGDGFAEACVLGDDGS